MLAPPALMQVYLAPYNEGGVGVFDALDEAFTMVSVPGVSGPAKFSGAAALGSKGVHQRMVPPDSPPQNAI